MAGPGPTATRNTAHHLSRTMTPDLDPTTGAKRERLSRLWPAVFVGTAVLAVCNAQGLEKWASGLPDSPVTNAAIGGTQEWKALMDRLGPGRAFDAVRQAFRNFRGN